MRQTGREGAWYGSVSYTHLDVYKRQGLGTRDCISLPDPYHAPSLPVCLIPIGTDFAGQTTFIRSLLKPLFSAIHGALWRGTTAEFGNRAHIATGRHLVETQVSSVVELRSKSAVFG